MPLIDPVTAAIRQFSAIFLIDSHVVTASNLLQSVQTFTTVRKSILLIKFCRIVYASRFPCCQKLSKIEKVNSSTWSCAVLGKVRRRVTDVTPIPC